MEALINISPRIVAWLASMGYPVAGMPREMLFGMFMREARQWQLAPERLEALIYEASPVVESDLRERGAPIPTGDGRASRRTPDHIRIGF